MKIKKVTIFEKDLKKLRAKTNLSLLELADRTGINYYHLSRCENGRVRISYESWERIKKVLDDEKWWVLNNK